MTFSIQELGPDDVALARQLFLFFQHDDGVAEPTLPSDSYIACLLAKEDFHAIVALRESVVIGGLTAYELEMVKEETRELFVYEIAVEAAHRRQGIGSALIEFARDLCRARGLSALFLGAMADDARAVGFYEATGLKREDVAWFVQEFESAH